MKREYATYLRRYKYSINYKSYIIQLKLKKLSIVNKGPQ